MAAERRARRARRGTRYLVPLMTVIIGLGVANGQAPEQAVAYTYEISAAGADLGRLGMSVARGAEGTTAKGSATLAGGAVDIADELTTAPNGAARSYHLSGNVQGTPLVLDVEFGPTSADFEITQAGKQQALSLPLDGDVWVLDNNLIDGYQVLVDRVVAEGVALTFPVIVPQVAALGTFELSAPVPDTVLHAGAQVPVRRLDGKLLVGPSTVTPAIYVDDAGDLLLVVIQPGGVRIERSAADSASAAAHAQTHAVADALATNAACLVETDLSVASTGATLVGKLTLPRAAADGSGPAAPTLILLPGSGAVDLNGNAAPLLTNDGYQQLAYALACHGYGVLRASKLGIPPSSGDGNAVTLDTYAQNTADWAALLAEQPGVDARRLGIVGHSEGSLVALYATAKGYVAPRALVLLAGPGRPLQELLREQLLARSAEAGATEEQLATLAGQIDELVAAVRSSSGVALEATPELAKNPLLPLFGPAAGLLRSEFAADPAELARQVGVPVAVIQGRKDIQVSVADAELLAAALPHATLLLMADLTHNLVDTAGPALALPLPGPDALISPTVVSVVATYLAGHLTGAR